MSGRTVLVGDVHGCADELDRLLDLVGWSPSDRLVSVGDLVVRGPASGRTVARVRELGGRAVLGNHEMHLLRSRARRQDDQHARVHPLHEEPLATLGEDDWAFLSSLPPWLDLPEHSVRVVHAGVVPGRAIETISADDLVTMRTLVDGKPSKKRHGVFWGTQYVGPPHVVFGHDALSGLQRHRWATGLDTGCVYGGRLTALVLEAGASIPADPDARPLHAVQAERVYYEP